ncbi:Drug/metabolite transporter [Macleaya cordata]|uniref:Drug/metabolite transporter n=1 Tax=Macleaya cordata TaxID=56857 RepID=A0A200R2D5_MACCD|nr:Drug/metabolite transporter [Macleaya cordata]
MARKLCNIVHGLKPAIVMVVVQIVFAGMNVFYKLAINDGMNMKILVAYRSLFATAFVVPIAIFFERKIRPKLTWIVVFQAFLCGLFGSTLAQNLYVASLNLTSATFASAMTNLIPAITFIMAIAFGLEMLGFESMAGKAKVLGTLIGIGGAMLLTFYKGVEIPMWSTHALHIHHGGQGGHVAASHAESGKRVLGSLLAVGSCLSYATWLIIQTKMGEKYPCYYSSTALMCLMGSIQSVGFALCTERDWTQWKLGWNIRLLAVAYTGILASGLMVTLIAWCVHVRGPLFVSIFNPLMLVLVAIAGSILLDEKLHLGSVLGAVLIVIGLYFVLWGKAKEMKKRSRLMPSKSSRESEARESDAIEVMITSSSTDNNNTTTTANTVALNIDVSEIQPNPTENISSNNASNNNLEHREFDIEDNISENEEISTLTIER